MIDIIREKAVTEEFDYNFLMSCLSAYRNPRDKITRFLKSGDIIRVKKGLYVFGPKHAMKPYSREVLANLIYGPSYISLDYALSFYRMIPERVETVTSITCKRNKFFKTPVGNFSYKYLIKEKYYIGIEQFELDENRHILIASREKALADKVAGAYDIETINDMNEYLLRNLRIDESDLKTLRISKLHSISRVYNDKRVAVLYETIREKR